MPPVRRRNRVRERAREEHDTIVEWAKEIARIQAIDKRDRIRCTCIVWEEGCPRHNMAWLENCDSCIDKDHPEVDPKRRKRHWRNIILSWSGRCCKLL